MTVLDPAYPPARQQVSHLLTKLGPKMPTLQKDLKTSILLKVVQQND